MERTDLTRRCAAATAGRRLRGLVAFCAVAGCAGAGAQGCSAVQLEASAGRIESRWEEFDQRGRQLLRETGPLSGVGLVARAHCWDLDWQADVHAMQGTRDYAGSSNTGGAIRTSSRIEQSAAGVEVLKAINPRWRLGARASYQDIRRELLGIGPVQGYPEHYRYWRASIGTRYTLVQSTSWELLGSAWLGGGPAGRMTLRLPGDDPATLTLGNSAHASVGLDWQGRQQQPEAPGWSWRAGVNYSVEQIEAGRAQVITRNGVVVGAALQPRTRQSGLGLAAGLRYDF